MAKTPYEIAVERAISDDVTTRELALLLREHNRQNALVFAAMRQADRLSKDALELRLHALNELRKQVTEDRASFVTKLVYEVQHDRILEDVRMLRESKANLEGKASQMSVMVATAIGCLGLALGMIDILLHLWRVR